MNQSYIGNNIIIRIRIMSKCVSNKIKLFLILRIRRYTSQKRHTVFYYATEIRLKLLKNVHMYVRYAWKK